MSHWLQPAEHSGWLKVFKAEVARSRTEPLGDIEWITVDRLYTRGLNPWAAAFRYLESLKASPL